jgi:hypothetical protein
MSSQRHPTVAPPDQASGASLLSSRRGAAILLLLSIVQFMDVLDASIVNIVLPSILYRPVDAQQPPDNAGHGGTART